MTENLTMTVVEVTPEIARNWLVKNRNNFRQLDRRRVDKYTKEMKLGNWMQTGQGVIFSGGQLIDGQHRLEAVVKSGCTVNMLVIDGVDSSSAMYVDTGKPRSVKQWLMHKGVKNAGDVASVSKLLLFHQRGFWGLPSISKGRHDVVVDSEIIEYGVAFQEEINSALRLAARANVLGKSILAAVYLIGCKEEDPEDNQFCNWFSESLKTGAGLNDTQPVLHLRNRLIDDKSSHAHNGKKLSVFMKRMLVTIAWNKTVLGEPMKQLKFRMSGNRPDTAPDKVLPVPSDV